MKIRRPIDLGTGEDQLSDSEVMRLKGVLQCEPPNANLHRFQGRFEVDNINGTPGKLLFLWLEVKAQCLIGVMIC